MEKKNRYYGGKAKRAVWLYFWDHRRHPFINLCIESLTSAGYSVTVIDQAAEKGGGIHRHVALKLPFFHKISCLLKICYLFLLSLMLVHTLKARPAVIIVSAPHVIRVGWLAAVLLRSRLIYYPFELFGEQFDSPPDIVRKVEVPFLRRVHTVITQNNERARIYVQERGCRVTPKIVHNYKRFQKVERSGKLRQLLGLPEAMRIVLYEGILAPGRCLDKLIQSVPYLPEDAGLVFIGEIHAWWKEKAVPLLEIPSNKGKIFVHDWIPHRELLDYLADADVGVIIYDNSVRNNYYCEPGKLSDYILSGVPVIGPDFPTIAPVIARYSIGAVFVSQEPEEIARAINKVLSTPRNIWDAALDRARKDLVWETQAPTFLRAVSGN